MTKAGAAKTQKKRILSSLSEKNLSAEELSNELNVAVSSIQRRLDELRMSKEIRISGWYLKGNRIKRRYGKGSAPGVRKPEIRELMANKSGGSLLQECQQSPVSRKQELHSLELHKAWDAIHRQIIGKRLQGGQTR